MGCTGFVFRNRETGCSLHPTRPFSKKLSFLLLKWSVDLYRLCLTGSRNMVFELGTCILFVTAHIKTSNTICIFMHIQPQWFNSCMHVWILWYFIFSSDTKVSATRKYSYFKQLSLRKNLFPYLYYLFTSSISFMSPANPPWINKYYGLSVKDYKSAQFNVSLQT